MKFRDFYRPLLLICFCILSFSEIALAKPPKNFVTVKEQGPVTDKLKWKVKLPKLGRNQVLKTLQLRGCWVEEGAEGLKSIKVTNSRKQVLKLKVNKKTGIKEVRKLVSSDFPLKFTATFTGPRTLVPQGSAMVAVSKTVCHTGKACDRTASVEVEGLLPGAECAKPSDFEEARSTATIVLADGDELDLQPLSKQLAFTVVDGNFASDISDATVTVNDVAYYGSDLSLTDNILKLLPLRLIDGVNIVKVHALDSLGHQMDSVFEIYAGANNLTVKLQNEAGESLQNGAVKLTLGDKKEINQILETTTGQVVFQNIPSRTIALEGTSPDGSFGFAAITGGVGTFNLKLIGFSEPNEISNNDFASGTDGWDIGTAPVSVVIHDEGDQNPKSLDRSASNRDGPPDQDIILHTSGEGVQYISRTFPTKPGTRSVSVRYRFRTTEFPKYYGSRYNDYYNVAIRTRKGGGNLSDGNSMNAMGQGTFDASGSTAWRTATLPVNKQGDDVQIQIAAANVADGAFNSSVQVDYVQENSFAVTSAELLDIDGSRLENISGGSHPYFEHFTYINGNIKLEGQKGDVVQSVVLQIMEGTSVVATAELSTKAQSKILKKFPKSGVIEIKDSQLLFKIFPKELEKMTSTTNKSYSLRIKAVNGKGTVSEFNAGTVQLLILYPSQSRYGQRDTAVGGDDWIKPGIQSTLDQLGLVWGDFSNMNGGRFHPHDEHQDGRDADAWFDGYNQRNGETAARILEILNGPAGSRINRVLVAFHRSPGNSFWRAIQGKTLKNGRSAERVIIPDGQHTTHFHLDIAN